MAVTSRNLHQPPQRSIAGSELWKPRLELWAPYLRAALGLVLVYLLVALLGGWGQVWIDDVRYGRPRTSHVAGMVGHNEGGGEPTHIFAMNLNRRVVVMELPGGDAAKARTLQGPYLFGADEDLTPVVVRLQDVNDDAKDDLVLAVKREEIIYVNDGESFRLINSDERKQLKRDR